MTLDFTHEILIFYKSVQIIKFQDNPLDIQIRLKGLIRGITADLAKQRKLVQPEDA